MWWPRPTWRTPRERGTRSAARWPRPSHGARGGTRPSTPHSPPAPPPCSTREPSPTPPSDRGPPRSGRVDHEDRLLAGHPGEDDGGLRPAAGLAPDAQLAAQLVVVQANAALLDRQPGDAVLPQPGPQGPLAERHDLLHGIPTGERDVDLCLGHDVPQAAVDLAAEGGRGDGAEQPRLGDGPVRLVEPRPDRGEGRGRRRGRVGHRLVHPGGGGGPPADGGPSPRPP